MVKIKTIIREVLNDQHKIDLKNVGIRGKT